MSLMYENSVAAVNKTKATFLKSLIDDFLVLTEGAPQGEEYGLVGVTSGAQLVIFSVHQFVPWSFSFSIISIAYIIFSPY